MSFSGHPIISAMVMFDKMLMCVLQRQSMLVITVPNEIQMTLFSLPFLF